MIYLKTYKIFENKGDNPFIDLEWNDKDIKEITHELKINMSTISNRTELIRMIEDKERLNRYLYNYLIIYH